MIVGTWPNKQPYEIEPVTMRFTPRLAAGETLTSALVTAKNANTGLNADVILVGPLVIDGGDVTRLVTGGISGTAYIVEYKAVTSNGRQLEDEVGVTVIET